MEENEIVETTETPVEETQEQVSEEVEEVADDLPTLEDYEKLKKEKETLAAQKEHWRKKAEEKKLVPQVETPQVSTNQLTRDEVFLIAKGVSEEVINEARFRADAKGISLKEAMEDPVVITLQKEVEARERRSKAQLPPSSGGTSVRGVDLINAVGMTEEEHRKAIGM